MASGDLLALDEALERLMAVNERHARIVECRFYGGMSVEEIAGDKPTPPSSNGTAITGRSHGSGPTGSRLCRRPQSNR